MKNEYVTREEFEAFKLTVFPPKEPPDLSRMPVVKFVSKYWQGEDFRGKPFDECSAEFLESHARFLRNTAKWKSSDPSKAKYARYDLMDAEIAEHLAYQKKNAPAEEDSLF